MIFITVGTQKFQFNRLLRIVDAFVEKGIIRETVFAQIGDSDYKPQNYRYEKTIAEPIFRSYMQRSSMVISHGGVGNIMVAFQMGKKIIVVPREKKYGEHVDDHQVEISETFAKAGYLLMATDWRSLKEALQSVETFEPRKYESSDNQIADVIGDFLRRDKIPVLMVGSDLSVRGGIVSVLKNYLNCEYWKNTEIRFVSTHIEGSKIQKIKFFWKALFAVRNEIKNKKIKIVHIHVSERGSFLRKSLVLHLAKLYRCKVILHHHGAEFEPYYRQASKRGKKYIEAVLEKADVNLVLSSQMLSVMRQINPQANIRVLYNAVEASSHNPYDLNANEITMLGRLEERKGTFQLLETIQMIDAQLDSSIKFNLCGDGDLSQVYKKISELGVEHRISHIGWSAGEEKEKILKNTMCHVLFSNNEGLPMAILETMGRGIVNIATNIAAIPEVIVDRETGILVEPGDTKHLGEVLLEVSQNTTLRKKISENAHQLIWKKFSLESCVGELEKIYEGLLSEKNLSSQTIGR